MPTNIKPGTVIFTGDHKRLAKFYEAMTGLTVRFVDDKITVLGSDTLELVIHSLPGEPAVSDPPLVRQDNYIKPFFPVISLSEAREKAAALGGQLRPQSEEWEARGFRACEAIDPDGNGSSFARKGKDEGEGSKMNKRSLFIPHPFGLSVAFLSAAVLLAAINPACSKSNRTVSPEDRSIAMTIKITSPSFAEGQTIPSKYTCDGENLSPPLSWDQVPEAAKTFALICDDPDAPAGTWVHWVLYDLPATTRELHEAVEPKEELPNGARQGRNDFKQIGYGGPCPPKGGPHRYYFKLYALDRTLGLKPGATKSEVEGAMKGHILGEGKLMGTYKRK